MCGRYGGQTVSGNIVAACYECNQARGQVTNRTRIRTEYDLARTAAVGKLLSLYSSNFRATPGWPG